MGETKLREIILACAGVLLLAFVFTYQGSVTTNVMAKDVSRIKESCSAIENKENCYAKAFENLTSVTDWNYSFEVLRKLQEVDPQARGCHFIAHSITTTETNKDISKWREIMNSAPPDCSYGAAHGALEAYAATFPDGNLPEDEIPNLCNNPDTKNCTHGLGHLLLVLNKDDIDKSVDQCNNLPHDQFAKFECVTGVFMERITAFNLVTHGLADESALNWVALVPKLETLCRTQSSTASVACWKEIVHAALVKFRNNPQQIVNFCETAQGEEEARQCIDHSLGIIASSYNFDLSQMKPICEAKAKASDFKERCYAHLVSSTLSTIPQAIPDAVKFCGSLKNEHMESCFTMIGNTLQFATPERKGVLANECSRAPKEFRKSCTEGGNTTVRFYSGN